MFSPKLQLVSRKRVFWFNTLQPLLILWTWGIPEMAGIADAQGSVRGGRCSACAREHTHVASKYHGFLHVSNIWLVVSTPLKNISQWEGLSHILWKIKNVPNHQPDINALFLFDGCSYFLSWFWGACTVLIFVSFPSLTSRISSPLQGSFVEHTVGLELFPFYFDCLETNFECRWISWLMCRLWKKKESMSRKW